MIYPIAPDGSWPTESFENLSTINNTGNTRRTKKKWLNLWIIRLNYKLTGFYIFILFKSSMTTVNLSPNLTT